MSNQLVLVADTNRETGSGAAGRLRRQGQIPAVVYGLGIEPLSISVPWPELRRCLITDAGTNALISLRVGDATHLSLVKEIQRHPVRRDVTHIDFLTIDPNKKVTVDIPVHLIGEAREVLNNQGMVDQQLFRLLIEALPAGIPSEIEVDITDLTIGSSINVGELTMPDGCTAAMPEDTTVVVGVETRAAVEEEEGEAGEAGEEGEASAESTDGAAEASSEDSAGE